MFNSVYLDIAIGMIFIFLLYSILATAILEIFATWINIRGKYLRRSIHVMMNDFHLGNKLASDFYEHPLIRKISFSRKDRLPSYIDPELFSKVVKDVLPDVNLGKDRDVSDQEKIRLLPDGELKKALTVYMEKTATEVDTQIQKWFNNSMDRLSGAYKRMTQNRLLIIGLILAVTFNVNSISVFTRLAADKEARAALVKQAEDFMEANQNYDSMMQKYKRRPNMDSLARAKDSAERNRNDSVLFEHFKKQRDSIKAFIDNDIKKANNAIGIGWDAMEGDTFWKKLRGVGWDWPATVLGWIITAFAITLGAPFWFDLLKKVIRIRGSGVKPEEEKTSKK
jgi:hypothetical protein